jgi:hypothetical protein
MYCWRLARVVPFSAVFTSLILIVCWLPPPTVILSVPVNCSLELTTGESRALEVVLLEPAVTVAPSVLLAAAAIELAVTAMLPLAPEVPETRLSREPLASVSTLAEMPRPEELMVEARPASVLSEELRVKVCDVPLPTWSVTLPDSVSALLAISAR